MPNHVTNVIRTDDRAVIESLWTDRTPEEIARLEEEERVSLTDAIDQFRAAGRDKLADRLAEQGPTPVERGVVDFGRIIPEPREVVASLDDQRPLDLGMPVWRTWRVKHWGTKWNAYDVSLHQLEDGRWELRFDTAWSHPGPVMNALMAKHPDAALEVLYADEDRGYNLGHYRSGPGAEKDADGYVKQLEPAAGTREAELFAHQVIDNKPDATMADLEAWEREVYGDDES